MPTTTEDLYRYSQTLGFYAQIGRGFNNPVDVALGHDGVLYVLNRAGADIELRMPYKRVTMCTLAEDYLGDFSSGGGGEGQLMWPVAIVIDAEERIYISDEALHRISIFDKQGRFLSQWGARGSGEGEFNRPAGIAFDAEQHLLVVDGRNHRIQRYGKDGSFLGQWGSAGRGAGEFNLPWGIAVDRTGDIYVADWRNDRIQKFDAEGRFLAAYGPSGRGDGEFRRPAGVTIDGEGNIYIADWGNERVQVLAPDGSFLAKFRGEAGLSKWGESYFIANQDELEERQKADLEPELNLSPSDDLCQESASIEKFFWGPTAVKVDDQGRVYVVDSCRHRIQVYCKNARPG
jgi:DNA-binding beta-propeller fold protein YncE